MCFGLIGPFAAVALLILGVLLSAAVGAGLGNSDKVRERATKATMSTYADAISAYTQTTGAMPPNLAALATGGYLTSLNDAWGRPLTYAVPGRSGARFTLTSVGPDGVAGTSDDVNWP